MNRIFSNITKIPIEVVFTKQTHPCYKVGAKKCTRAIPEYYVTCEIYCSGCTVFKKYMQEQMKEVQEVLRLRKYKFILKVNFSEEINILSTN